MTTSKSPHSFSFENELMEEFKIICANESTSPSKKVRSWVIKHLEEHRIKIKLNKQKKPKSSINLENV